jgi:hypothetical protein
VMLKFPYLVQVTKIEVLELILLPLFRLIYSHKLILMNEVFMRALIFLLYVLICFFAPSEICFYAAGCSITSRGKM